MSCGCCVYCCGCCVYCCVFFSRAHATLLYTTKHTSMRCQTRGAAAVVMVVVVFFAVGVGVTAAGNTANPSILEPWSAGGIQTAFGGWMMERSEPRLGVGLGACIVLLCKRDQEMHMPRMVVRGVCICPPNALCMWCGAYAYWLTSQYGQIEHKGPQDVCSQQPKHCRDNAVVPLL